MQVSSNITNDNSSEIINKLFNYFKQASEDKKEGVLMHYKLIFNLESKYIAYSSNNKSYEPIVFSGTTCEQIFFKIYNYVSNNFKWKWINDQSPVDLISSGIGYRELMNEIENHRQKMKLRAFRILKEHGFSNNKNDYLKIGLNYDELIKKEEIDNKERVKELASCILKYYGLDTGESLLNLPSYYHFYCTKFEAS